MEIGKDRVMSVKNLNYQWLSIVLLSLVFTGLNGCDNDSQEQGPETATARLKVLSEDMSADDITQIRALIKAGADVNVKGTDDRTALWVAAWKGHAEIVKLLLESKADVNAANIYSATALIVASQTDIVKALLEAKADVNAAHANGGTALSRAASIGNTEIVRMLLEAGADVDAKSRVVGMTALWQAASRGHAEIVKALLEAKADVNAKAHLDGKDYTPLSIAKMMGRAEVIKLLKEYGAKD